MERFVKPGRVVLFVLIVVALAAVYIVALYKLQVVEGAAYYESSLNNIVTEKAVKAKRGDIMDRYGRVLVSSKTCNNLIINTDELFKQDDPNAAILRIALTVKDCGETYIDTLPITEAPFEYVPNMTDIQRRNLNAYLEAKNLPEDTTAVELMAFFRSDFDIDSSYDSEQTRIIAGVRYEVKVRYVVNTSDYIFAEDVGIELITRIMEGDLKGVDVDLSYVREYKTIYAAHLLGYVGLMNEEEYEYYGEQGYLMNAEVGKEGAEKAFESYLHGQDGTAATIRTASGTVTNTIYTEEPEPGNHVYLTIDIAMNEVAEQALATGIAKINEDREVENELYRMNGMDDKVMEMAKGGALVVVDVKTGEPLCMANYPSYSLTTFWEDYEELLADDYLKPLYNRALQGEYAPGSTFKMCTALAALNEGIISTGTTIYDEGKFTKYEYAGYAPTCWFYGRGSHGDVNVTGALETSCNYFFYTIGDLLGIDRLVPYALSLGLGSETGIELPESLGIMSSPEYKMSTRGEQWRAGDTLQAAIGQFDSQFTPLQIASYVATIANDGVRYSTSLLKTVRSFDFADKVFERAPEVMSETEGTDEYYDAIKQGMKAVSLTGTAAEVFKDYPVSLAAKTGTAQLGTNVTNNGVFVCYAPFDDPQIAIAVVVEKGGSGSGIASIVKEVLDYYFNFESSMATQDSELTLLK